MIVFFLEFFLVHDQSLKNKSALSTVNIPRGERKMEHNCAFPKYRRRRLLNEVAELINSLHRVHFKPFLNRD